MGQIAKTVFISYRRANLPWALNIFQYLTAHGYDVFFDYESIHSGDFERVILTNIRARAHFLVVLTPSALERCVNPDDWLRREIETALDKKLNIVPLFLEGFNFDAPSISNQLIGKLTLLKGYNGLNIPSDYFPEAMERLKTRYLNVPLDSVLHPVSDEFVKQEVEKQQTAARIATEAKENELKAQELFEQAHKYWLDNNLDETIRCTTEAIRLNPNFAEAYNRRGAAKLDKQDFDNAIKDFNESIRLKPNFDKPYFNRGTARNNKGDFDGAIEDYTEAIRLKPDDASAYNARGHIRSNRGDFDEAISDYTDAIRLKPDDANAYFNRAFSRDKKSEFDEAILDYTEAIRLGSNDAITYNNRAASHIRKGNYDNAIKDCNEAIHINPDYAIAYRNRGIAWNEKGEELSALVDFKASIKLGDRFPDILQKRLEELEKKLLK